MTLTSIFIILAAPLCSQNNIIERNLPPNTIPHSSQVFKFKSSEYTGIYGQVKVNIKPSGINMSFSRRISHKALGAYQFTFAGEFRGQKSEYVIFYNPYRKLVKTSALTIPPRTAILMSKLTKATLAYKRMRDHAVDLPLSPNFKKVQICHLLYRETPTSSASSWRVTPGNTGVPGTTWYEVY
jgi:hypothetical protein